EHLPDFIEAQKRQQARDRALLKHLSRFDPAYHRLMADRYEKSSDLFAAGFHLRRLLLITPKDDVVRKRLAAVEARLCAESRGEVPLPEKQPAKMLHAR